MSENALGNLFTRMANSIRGGLGEIGKMKPVTFPDKVDGIVSLLEYYKSGADEFNAMLDEINGEVINGVLVTFIGLDGSVLCEISVLPGKNCPNPVTTGLIARPTKESSVSTVYTYSGWSMTEGGEADANVLHNITENRTVYVAFSESVRYYTIRFYDGETLRKTEQVPYGGSSDYTYYKIGHYFQRWEPEPVNVASDMDCYGVWERAAFATDSWEQISENCRAGNAADFYKVGDERTMHVSYGGAYDGVSGANVFMRVAHIGSEFDYNGNTMSGMVILCATPWHSAKMAYRAVNDKSDTYASLNYLDSDVYEYLLQVHDLLPNELTGNIRNARKSLVIKYAHFTNNDTMDMALDLWPLSIAEVYGSGLVGGYDVFKTDSGAHTDAMDARIMRLPNGNAVPWMLRDPVNFDEINVVQTDGSIRRGYVTDDDAYVVFALFL